VILSEEAQVQKASFKTVAFVLRYGALASALLMALGVILAMVLGGDLAAPHRLDEFPRLLAQLGDFDPGAISELGLVILLMTPVARVVATFVEFSRAGERRYAAVALSVLAVVLYSMSFAVRG
jgi:uncharacterized membrane protein